MEVFSGFYGEMSIIWKILQSFLLYSIFPMKCTQEDEHVMANKVNTTYCIVQNFDGGKF